MRFGTPEQFASLRELLIESEYTETSICNRRGQSSLREVEANPCEDRPVADSLDVLVRLLLHGLPVDQSTANNFLPTALLAALRDFDLIAPQGPDYQATLMLHPWGSLYVTSDSVRAAQTPLPPDFVFPALTPQTGRFLASLPDDPCDNLLDLCSGSGIAALIAASSYARRVWASDVVGRATQFAEFNRRLSNLSNLTPVEGDLYQPVQGLTFDRIVAHPPYVPSLQPMPACLDGGPDGEQITCRILASLSGYLSPGGKFYCSAMLSDRRGARLEDRLRAMLGPGAEEFDLILRRREAFTPVEYCLRLTSLGQTAPAHIRQLQTRFEQLEIERLVPCSLSAHRRL